MDEQAFRRFLKQRGKKEHVVDGLVAQVRAFADYLARAGRPDLDAATAEDVRAYAAALEAAEPGSGRKKARALALYYAFRGNSALAELASGLREAEIARTRRAFPLRDFRGVDPAHAARLEAAGIATVDDLLAAGATPAARARLAEATGIPPDAILELVKLSDLSRVGAIKAVRARLYYDAGIDTPDAFARWEPEALHAFLVEWVARTGFDGIAPLPKEVRNGVARARELPRLVEYE